MPLPHEPTLIWGDGAFARDGHSGDVFYSQDGGLEEARAVFLTGCGLPERWTGKSRFAIGELGFGSGLNALACWQLWQQTRPPGAILHYFSLESRPWNASDAARAHSAFPEIADLSAQIIERWPHRAFGTHRRWFARDGFCLTILIGDALESLQGLRGAFDCWLLDGFAPAKNPQMWSGPVMQELARLSAPGARAATYSVAGPVRTALSEAGFALHKQPGFGRKRHRLEATLAAPPPPGGHDLFPRACAPLCSAGAEPAGVLVIGAGIAGAAVTRALSQRGARVSILEAAPGPAAGASGNPLALLTPRLDRSDDAGARFFRAAYLAALDAYIGQPWFHTSGAIQRPRDLADAEALALLLADPPLPPELLQSHSDGVWHPCAGVLEPAALIAAWTAPALVQCSATVTRLDREDGRWLARDSEGQVLGAAEAVVICAGPALAGLSQSAWLPMAWSLGQIEFTRHCAAEELAEAITGKGYAARRGRELIFGATFEPQDHPDLSPPHPGARARNIAALKALTGHALGPQAEHALISRTGIRASVPDRLPIAGLMPDAPVWLRQQAGLAHGRPAELRQPAPAHAGLYVLGGFSARGFLVAPLLGELIAAEICGEPAPMEAAMLDALHPCRFLLRALKRGQTLPGA